MRRTYGPTVGLIFALALATACANTTALEAELSRLRRELHFVRQDLAKQKRSVESLERRITLVSLGQGAAPSTTDARSEVVVEPPPPASVTMMQPKRPAPPDQAQPRMDPRRRTLPVVRLGANAQPKPVRPEEWVDPGAQDDGGPPLKFEMGPSSGGGDDRLSVDRSVLDRPDPVLDPDRPRPARSPRPPARPRPSSASKKQVKAEYKTALARLREDREAQEALQLFDQFLAAHPRSRFADNAAYWRGECLFALAKHEEAIVAFDKLFETHPRSPKVPFALVRKGESLLVLGRRPAAIEAFRKVTEDYASSEAAETAKGLLARQKSRN